MASHHFKFALKSNVDSSHGMTFPFTGNIEEL